MSRCCTVAFDRCGRAEEERVSARATRRAIGQVADETGDMLAPSGQRVSTGCAHRTLGTRQGPGRRRRACAGRCRDRPASQPRERGWHGGQDGPALLQRRARPTLSRETWRLPDQDLIPSNIYEQGALNAADFAQREREPSYARNWVTTV